MMWAPIRRPKPDPRAGLGFNHSAPHIKGRVFRGERLRSGRWLWRYEVINAHTGEVIISDNTGDFARMAFACHQSVAVARGAWFYDLTKKRVR